MNQANKKILIVDDDKMNIFILSHYLKPPYDIIIAQDGVTALGSAEKYAPDMILLDIIMPDMDGFEVFARLKESETAKNIPVIFMTGLDTDDAVDKGLSLGAAGYITKPFEKAAVKEKIDAFFNAGF